MDKTRDERTYEVASPNRTPEGKKEKDDDELTDDDDITLESSQAPRHEGDVLSQANVLSAVAESRKESALDAISQVPTEVISNMPSEAPTEKLANEYKRLMEEYDTICEGNKKMEEQID